MHQLQDSNYNIKLLLSSIVFFLSYSFLIVFLYFFRSGSSEYFLIFWVLILSGFSSILYSIFNFKKEKKSFLYLILLEIILLTFLLHSFNNILSDRIFFFTNDGYTLIQSANFVYSNPVFSQNSPDYAKWFSVHMITLSISELLTLACLKSRRFYPL